MDVKAFIYKVFNDVINDNKNTIKPHSPFYSFYLSTLSDQLSYFIHSVHCFFSHLLFKPHYNNIGKDLNGSSEFRIKSLFSLITIIILFLSRFIIFYFNDLSFYFLSLFSFSPSHKNSLLNYLPNVTIQGVYFTNTGEKKIIRIITRKDRKIIEIKREIALLINRNSNDVRLILNGRAMSDSHSLNFYHISSSSKVFILSALRGGGKEDGKKKINSKKIKKSSSSSDNEKQDDVGEGMENPLGELNKINGLAEVEYKDLIKEFRDQNTQLINQMSTFTKIQEEQNKKITKLTKKKKKKKYLSSSSSSSLSSSSSSSSSFRFNINNSSPQNSYSSSSSSKPRIINLKNIKEYDGQEEFREWIKFYNVQMNAGNYEEGTKLVTLVNHLGPNMQLWLANTDPEISKDYSRLCDALQNGFKKKQKTTRQLLTELTKIIQEEDEAVVTYETRLKAKVRDGCPNTTDEELKDLFISGLEPELQLIVRGKD